MFLKNVFNFKAQYVDEEGKLIGGIYPKLTYLMSGTTWLFPGAIKRLQIMDDVPLSELLIRLRKLFRRRYEEEDDDLAYQPVRANDMLNSLRDALRKDGWPDHKANDQLPVEARTGFVKKRTTELQSVEEERSCTTQRRASSKRPRDEMERTDEDVSEGELSSLQTAPASHEEPPCPDKNRKKPKK
jgi:hypothetical protein